MRECLPYQTMTPAADVRIAREIGRSGDVTVRQTGQADANLLSSSLERLQPAPSPRASSPLRGAMVKPAGVSPHVNPAAIAGSGSLDRACIVSRTQRFRHCSPKSAIGFGVQRHLYRKWSAAALGGRRPLVENSLTKRLVSSDSGACEIIVPG
jgi:hypothetical protein